jgi:hypothetical protein
MVEHQIINSYILQENWEGAEMDFHKSYRRIPLIILLLFSGFVSASASLSDDTQDSIAKNPFLIFDDPSFQESYESQFLQALAHFPELRHIHIHVRAANIATTMTSRPHLRAFVSSRKNREYLITVDTLEEKHQGLFFRLSDSARIGLIGHELAHILDYHHHHLPGVAGKGLEYLFHRRNLEHRADRIAIHHGLKSFLQQYARASFNPEIAGIRYVLFKRKYYYNPDELASIE